MGPDTALLFANASFNWVPDHTALLPRLMRALIPGGWLAVQMPYQHGAPSHALVHEIAHRLDPDAFPDTLARPRVLTPCAYADLLEPLGEVRIWKTEYLQRLGSEDEGHPVRRFTQSADLRPYLDHFTARGQGAEFLAAYDAALQEAYPFDEKGRVWFPFKRLFPDALQSLTLFRPAQAC
ncbi:MAG: hypothetical protein HWE33_11480 [Rhodobacteraceae bacterium]|nr:hypothetical protein [Paracoccaceae bacterium]